MSGLRANRIVVPIDFSELSFDALDRALEIVEDEGSIDVLHALANLPAMEYGNLYGTVTDESRIESTKVTLREKLAGSNFSKASIHVVIGDPGHEIAEFAKREKADLIVIPSHGYGFVKHMMLGSVAERVVRLAHCPVLVLRK